MNDIDYTAVVNQRGATGRTRAMIASTIGTIMEWFDFVTFAYLATYISHNFFPSDDDTASLLATFATFGVGFLARPLGGIIFGRYGDRHGRKAALMVTMLLMAGATVIIGLLPNYKSIGYAAPICLVIARFIQGMSAGGESTTAMVYAVEWAPKGKRGLFAGLQMAGSGFGLLLGSVTVSILVATLTTEQVGDWGWRIPFLVGFLIGPIGVWIRSSIGESPTYVKAMQAGSGPAKRAVPWRGIAVIILLDMPWAISYYVFLSYMPTFAQKYLHVAGPLAFSVNTLSLVVYIATIPLFGMLSDKVGRKPILLVSNIGIALLAYPLFKILVGGVSVSGYVSILLIFSILLSMYSGAAVAVFAEQFPAKIRNQWFSISYGIGVALFGGFTPFVATWLIEKLHTPLAPTFYITVTAAIGAIVVLTLRETAHDDML